MCVHQKFFQNFFCKFYKKIGNNQNSGNIENKAGDWSWGGQKQDVPKQPTQDFASSFSIPNQNPTNFSSNVKSSNPFENVQKQGPPPGNLPNTFGFNKAKTVDPVNFDVNGNVDDFLIKLSFFYCFFTIFSFINNILTSKQI